MNKTRLSSIRDFLIRWNAIGRRIMTGDVVGAQVILLDSRGNINSDLMGEFDQDTDLARHAALLTAYDLTPAEEPAQAPSRLVRPKT